MNSVDVVYKVNKDVVREVTMLWVNEVPPRLAPKHARAALKSWYKHFNCAQAGVGLMLQIQTGDQKSPEQLRQLAREAVDTLNELTAVHPPAIAMALYRLWATKRGVAA